MRERSEGFRPIHISEPGIPFSSEPQTDDVGVAAKAPETKRQKKKTHETVTPPVVDDTQSVEAPAETTEPGDFTETQLAAWRQKNKDETEAVNAAKAERAKLYQSQVENDYQSQAFIDFECARRLEFAESLYGHLNERIDSLSAELPRLEIIQDLQTKLAFKKYLAEGIAHFQTKLANAGEMLNLLNLGKKLATETDEEKISDLKQAIMSISLPTNLEMPVDQLKLRKDLAERDIENLTDQLYAQYPDMPAEKKFQQMSLILSRQSDLRSIEAEISAQNQGMTTVKPQRKILPLPSLSEPDESVLINKFQDHGLPPTQDLPIQNNDLAVHAQAFNTPDSDITQLPTMGYSDDESSLSSAISSSKPNLLTPVSKQKSSRLRRAWQAFWSPAI